MALSADFSTSESLSSNNLITFTDISTGSDGGLTERRIYCRLANGNYLTTSGESTTSAYEVWPIADTSIVLDLLTESTTANVTVQWMTGSTVTYTKTRLQTWDLYDYLFAFELIQDQTANPKIINDANYYTNFFQFITNIWCAETANTYGNDLYSSQQQLNVNQNLIINSDKYF